MRNILHSDMNNFYASVECMLNPSLKGKPVAVCGSVEERHGIVLAKNYPAKAYGVQTGEAVWQAQQKCPDLVIVPLHFDEYIKYSKLAREVYSRYTNQVEPYGMDECWLDISEYNGKNPEAVAYEIKEMMKERYPEATNTSLGLNSAQVIKFVHDFKIDDFVISYNPQTHNYLIGRITSDYYYSESLAEKYNQNNEFYHQKILLQF